MKTFLGVALVLDLNRAKVVKTWEEEVLVGRLGSNRRENGLGLSF